MQKRGLRLWMLLLIALFVFQSGGCGGSSSGGGAPEFSGGSGTSEDPWQIGTATQLESVRNHLGGHFILTGDIDLASYENWKPIGAFVIASDEDEETPDMELAFTGVFDGKGHKISNVTIDDPAGNGVGLFGCIAGETGSVSNLTVENVDVKGGSLTGGVVGYGFGSAVRNVRLIGNNRIEGDFIAGGIVGGGFCDIVGCDARASVTLIGDGTRWAGVLAGGMEESLRIVDCSATGSVTVKGENCFGIGGLVGCAFNVPDVSNCTSDVVITVGENGSLIGGLVGCTGEDGGVPTSISGCSARAAINVPQSAERIGGIVGGGFFLQLWNAVYAAPGKVTVVNCKTSGEIGGGSIAGSILGYAYNNSTVQNCTTDMTVNDQDGTAVLIGADADDITLDKLK